MKRGLRQAERGELKCTAWAVSVPGCNPARQRSTAWYDHSMSKDLDISIRSYPASFGRHASQLGAQPCLKRQRRQQDQGAQKPVPLATLPAASPSRHMLKKVG